MDSAVNNHCSGSISLPSLIRKLETEKLRNRDERLALNLALNSSDRKDFLMRTPQNMESGTSSRCALRRLKTLVHRNTDGLLSLDPSTSCNAPTPQRDNLRSSIDQSISATIRKSERSQVLPNLVNVSSTKYQSRKTSPQNLPLIRLPPSNRTNLATITPPACNNMNNSIPIGSERKRRTSSDSFATQFPIDENTRGMMIDADRAISSVVGDWPVYSGHGCYGACIKIGCRLNEHKAASMKSSHKMRPVRFAVLVGSGSCNPLTRMHLRSYFLAKQFLENTSGYVVLGSILCPSHGVTVRERYRNHPTEVIPSPHRLAVAQLMVESSKWISVDPWDITRRRPMDYLSLLQHCKHALAEGFPDVDIKIFYLCKENMIPKISPLAMRQENFGCISVCRPLECIRVKKSLSSKWNGVIWIAEDAAMIDASMDIASSREVRQKVRRKKSVKHLVGGLIDAYFKDHLIGAKMSGASEWTENELHLPSIPSGPGRRIGPAVRDTL